jgi:hypothetical protein
MTEAELGQVLELKQKAGLETDPATAEVDWCYAETMDPYGINPDLPEVYSQIGRAYFARSPGSDIWVEFGDLAVETSDALWRRHGRKLRFPAGLADRVVNGPSAVHFERSGVRAHTESAVMPLREKIVAIIKEIRNRRRTA